MTSTSTRGLDPLVLIPGMTGETTALAAMEKALENSGWPPDLLFKWTDSSRMTQDLAIAAQELSLKIDDVLVRTGAARVVLCTWSASALAARHYIKNLGGTAKVSQYISFAAPQHGTANNDCQQYVACQQFGDAGSAFLTALNASSEVPGSPAVKYLTIRSTNDVNVIPTDSAMLRGANENFLLGGADAPTHFTIVSDAAALDKMVRFIKENA